jgi:hypothetical protein
VAEPNDIYQVKLSFDFLGELQLNVFWYQVPSSSVEAANAEDLLDEFDSIVVQPIREIVDDSVGAALIEATNWRDPTDHFTNTYPSGFGLLNGVILMPSFVCITFRSPKPTPGLRYAYKRIGAQTTSHVQGNTAVDASSHLSDVAGALAASLEGEDGLYAPVQVRTSTLPPLGSGQPNAIRSLYGTWTFAVGSQNTRKAGVGS